ncbi:hypothetical protein ACLB2K_020880 [Fragaria x ananassa]
MTNALAIKNKAGLVNGSSSIPTEENNKQMQWDRVDTLVRTWLTGSMTKEISKSVKHYKSAQDIWLELQERFSQNNTVQLFNVENAIHDCKQGTETVTTFYNRLKGVWDERDSLCDLSTEVIHGGIVAIDPLSTMNKTYAIALRHEKQAEAITSRKVPVQPEGATFAASSGSSRVPIV